VTFRYLNDTGHFSDVDFKASTKILETIPNPGNFAGKPPHTAAQPPSAVAKYVFKPLIISLYKLLFGSIFLYLI
jgi:hypothetical protein